MDVEITKEDGIAFRLSEYDVEVRDFIVGSPEIRPEYGMVEGRKGNVDMGASYGSRTIVIPFYFKAYDLLDVALLRDKLFGLLADVNPFYIREMRRVKHHPGVLLCEEDSGRFDDKYVGGKRYKVRLSSGFEIEQEGKYGFGELTFETTDLSFAESIGTSLDIERDGINANSEIWSYGMGLIAENGADKYVHTSNSFRIFNAGNVGVHPFEQDLTIEITGVSGKGFELRNNSTGDSFVYSGQLRSSDVLVIEGATVTVNGLQALRESNKRFISFADGWNSLTKNMSGKVSVDMRFYYK